jgi:plastocyanin domain-containing protein
MSALQWAVLLAGIAAIAWVNWWFFLASRGPVAEASGGTGGTPEVLIAVRGGYRPAVVKVAAGQRVRLVFDRQEDDSCSEELVIPDFGIRRFLPAHERTVVELTPPGPGTHEFTCGMGMLHGRVIAE